MSTGTLLLIKRWLHCLDSRDRSELKAPERGTRLNMPDSMAPGPYLEIPTILRSEVTLKLKLQNLEVFRAGVLPLAHLDSGVHLFSKQVVDSWLC